jgi:hypothetical protein
MAAICHQSAVVSALVIPKLWKNDIITIWRSDDTEFVPPGSD